MFCVYPGQCLSQFIMMYLRYFFVIMLSCICPEMLLGWSPWPSMSPLCF